MCALHRFPLHIHIAMSYIASMSYTCNVYTYLFMYDVLSSWRAYRCAVYRLDVMCVDVMCVDVMCVDVMCVDVM